MLMEQLVLTGEGHKVHSKFGRGEDGGTGGAEEKKRVEFRIRSAVR